MRNGDNFGTFSSDCFYEFDLRAKRPKIRRPYQLVHPTDELLSIDVPGVLYVHTKSTGDACPKQHKSHNSSRITSRYFPCVEQQR